MNNENNTVDNNSTDNSQALSELIQNIQAKMSSNENSKDIEDQNNITNSKNSNNNNNSNSNFSSILNNLDLSSILSAFGNSNSNNNNSSGNSNTFSGIDPNLILKIQKVMSSMSREDPKKNLLISLKPFLRKSRQDKINEYISMLTIVNAIEIFSDKGSDKNV